MEKLLIKKKKKDYYGKVVSWDEVEKLSLIDQCFGQREKRWQ